MRIPGLEGELRVDSAGRSEASRDFGRLVERMPRAVVTARSAADVARVIRFAQGEGLTVVARGQGHTTRGQSLVDDGIVIDTRALSDVTVGDGFAQVGAGCLWSELLTRTLATRQTPPVLTDFLGLSVGGTLSVGGIGGQSFRYGLQTDNVEALTVVTGAGELLVCSRTQHAELFDACRGGLGQCAVIVGARLRLVRAPERVRIYTLKYATLDAFLEDQRTHLIDGRFDYVLGSLVPEPPKWSFAVEVVKYLMPDATLDEKTLFEDLRHLPETIVRECGYAEYANRLNELVSVLKGARHPWMDLFVGASAARTLIAAAMHEFAPEQLTRGYVMTYPLKRALCSTPFLGLPEEPELYLFDLLPSFPDAESSAASQFETSCAKVFAATNTTEVSIYPIGFPVGRMTELDWKRQLGNDWASLCATKRQHDPDGVFSTALRIFPS